MFAFAVPEFLRDIPRWLWVDAGNPLLALVWNGWKEQKSCRLELHICRGGLSPFFPVFFLNGELFMIETAWLACNVIHAPNGISAVHFHTNLDKSLNKKLGKSSLDDVPEFAVFRS